MAQYISSAEVIAFIGPACNSTNAGFLVATSEAIFNQLVGSENGLASSAKTEYWVERDFKRGEVGRVFNLRTYKPTVITSINDASPGTLNTDYTLQGRRLEFEFAKDLPTTFPYRYKVAYTSGLATIPDEIKTCCLYLAKGMFDTKVAGNMSGFKQDLLSVNYSTGKTLETIVADPSEASFIRLIANKYLVPYFYAV